MKNTQQLKTDKLVLIGNKGKVTCGDNTIVGIPFKTTVEGLKKRLIADRVC